MAGRLLVQRNHLQSTLQLPQRKQNGWPTLINALLISCPRVNLVFCSFAFFHYSLPLFTRIQQMFEYFSSAGKQPLTEHAAVWIPDNEATLCMLCRKTKFTTLNRRVSATSIINYVFE
jgi:hypothetical protein